MYFVAKPNEEAKSFIQAAGLIDETQMKAIGTLVFDLKNYNIWDKMKAIYPMVGQSGVSSSFQFNLKDPSLFKGIFSGSWIFSSTGATPDGSTGYMNTGLVPSTSLLLNSVSLTFYSRTNIQGNIQMGVNEGSNYLIQSMNSSTQMFSQLNSDGPDYIDAPVTQWQGLFTTTRTTSTLVTAYKNGVNIKNDTKPSIARPNISIYLGARNNAGTPTSYDTKQCAFASIGDGLTDTEAANFYTAVQRFQTTLGRQV